MISKTNRIFTLLCAFALLATSPAEALIHRMVVLKKVINGTPHYIYFMGDYHLENTFASTIDRVKQALDPQTSTKDTAFLISRAEWKLMNGLLTPAKDQADMLQDYINQLATDSFVLINENPAEYNGNDENVKALVDYYQANRRTNPMTNGFVSVLARLAKKQSWHAINAECRYFSCFLGRIDSVAKVMSIYANAHKAVTDEVYQSTAPQNFKSHSMTLLETTQKNFASWLASGVPALDLLGMDLIDARIPHLLWKNLDKKHIFASFGSLHIDKVVKLLTSKEVGYEAIFSKGNDVAFELAYENNKFLQQHLDGQLIDDSKQLDWTFLNTIIFDLKKVFDEFSSKQKSNTQATELKQPEAKGNVCGNCGKSATNRCAICKTVYYCSAECQKLDWKNRHKQSCTTKKMSSSLTSPIPDNNKAQFSN